MKNQLLALVTAALLLSDSGTLGAYPTDHSLARVYVGIVRLDSAKHPPYDARWRSSPKRSLIDPVAFVMTYHAIGMGMLVSMDPKETGFKPAHIRNWVSGMTSPPIRDNDALITNFVLHPLWGSDTYLRARSAHFSPMQSFLFSTGASIVWEYGFESWAEHPSIQDLVLTSTVGSLLGELRYIAISALGDQDAWWATALLIVADPLGTLFSSATRLGERASGRITSAFTQGGVLEPALAGALRTQSSGDVGLRLAISL